MNNLILGTALSVATIVLPLIANRGEASYGGTETTQKGGPDAKRHKGDGRKAHGARGHRNPEQKIERMTADLGLSDVQAQQIRQIFADSQAERKALRESDKTTEIGEALSILHAHKHARIDAVLTPAQRERAATLRIERREAWIDQRVASMTDRLSLRAEQVPQIREILVEESQQHEALGRGPDHREAHLAVREGAQAKVDVILDADQRAKAEQDREAKGKHHGKRKKHHR